LFDRRFNPRPTSFIFQHLNSFMAELGEAVTLSSKKTHESGSVYAFKAGDRDFYLLLPHGPSNDGLLSLIDPTSLLRKSGRAKWANLESGELIEVSWKKAKSGDGISIDPMPSLNWPSVLVIE
jgi:hypothetical protein